MKKVWYVTSCILLIGVVLFLQWDDWFAYKPYPKFIERPHGAPIKKEPKALPNEWIGYQRAYPHNEIKHESYVTAMMQAEELHRQSSTIRENWELAGPTNVGGRITDLAIHPGDPDVIYVGAATGGIYKTTNTGQSWVNVFTDAPSITIGDIAIDPNNPDVIYAGTGEANSSSKSFFGVGLYKSDDGGTEWENIGLEQSAYIPRIIVDYNDSQRLFVAASGRLFSPNPERGIYRSTNGGEDWERVLFLTDSTAAVDLVQHPTNPDILYAAMWERIRGLNYRISGGESSGIWKTEDGGDTWNELTNGLPTHDKVGRIGLDICKSNPDVLYAFYDKQMEEDEYNSFLGVYKTTNGGDSWEQTNDGSLWEINRGFGWYFGQIRVDPNNPNRAYALGVELWRTENGGSSWEMLAGYDNTDEIHVDHHAMHIDDATGLITEGNDGGLYISTNNGENWTKINNLPMTQFYQIAVDYQNPNRLIGGTQDNGTNMTYTGALDDWQHILGGDGFYCIIDYQNPDIIYAEWQYGNLNKSENGGQEFYYIVNDDMYEDRCNWSTPVVMDPDDHETLYYGSYRVWKTTNGGWDFVPVSGDLTDGDTGDGYNTISTIAISPVDNDVVIVGTDDGNVHISTSGGGSWDDYTYGLPDRWVTRVACDPFDVNTFYVTLSGFRWDEYTPHVLMSTMGGLMWEDISANLPELPVNCMVMDPENAGTIFVGTDAGIFYTLNYGDEWFSLSAGIPNVPIFDLDLHNPTRTLIAGTYGCSAYKFDLTGLNAIQSENRLTNKTELSFSLGQNSPNPFNISSGGSAKTTISYSLPKSAGVKLTVYNIRGQKVKTLLDNTMDKGSYNVIWDGKNQTGQNVSSGVYFYRLEADGRPIQTKKLTIID